MIDFLLGIIEHFSLALTVQNFRRYKQILVEVGVFQSSGGFSIEGDSDHQPLLVSEN